MRKVRISCEKQSGNLSDNPCDLSSRLQKGRMQGMARFYIAILLIPAVALAATLDLEGIIADINEDGIVLRDAYVLEPVQETTQRRSFKTKTYPEQTRVVHLRLKADQGRPVFLRCNSGALEPGDQWTGRAAETNLYVYITNRTEVLMKAYQEVERKEEKP